MAGLDFSDSSPLHLQGFMNGDTAWGLEMNQKLVSQFDTIVDILTMLAHLMRLCIQVVFLKSHLLPMLQGRPPISEGSISDAVDRVSKFLKRFIVNPPAPTHLQ